VADEHQQPPPLTAELVGLGHDDLEARELAQHETDAVLDSINLMDIARQENKFSPRSGPFSPDRNQEVFKGILYIMDAERKKKPNVMDDLDAMGWYYAR
jgi:hypothetical protein